MKTKIDDLTIYRIFWILFGIFKKSAVKGEYLIFSPEKIEIISRKTVRYEITGTAKTLREGLRFLGATLYHLAAGKSEFNSESFQLDGYNEALESRYWPAIELLLSAQAFSLPQVEQMFSRGRRMLNLAKTAAAGAIGNLWHGLVVAWHIAVGICRRFNAKARIFLSWWDDNHIGVFFIIHFGLMVFLVIVQARYFTALGPVVLFLIFLVAGFALLLGTESAVKVVMTNSNRQRQQRFETIIETVFVAILLPLYAFAVCCMPFISDDTAEGVYSTKKNAVMTERSTGEFIGRVPLNAKDGFLVLPEAKSEYIWHTARFFNPIKHKVVPGLPLQGVVVGQNMNLSFNFTDPKKYIEAWKKFRTEGALKQELDAAALRLTQAKQQETIAPPEGKSSQQIIDSLKISAEGDLSDEQKQKIHEALVRAATAEINIWEDQRRMARREELKKAVQEELRREFAPYFDLTFDNIPPAAA